jgi:zinc transport system substrate-binding protein
MMRLIPIVLSIVLLVFANSLQAASTSLAPKVLASIKPIQALVNGVMEGVGTAELLVPEGASPHTYQLRPSNATAINQAELIFWLGPEFESFLSKALDNTRAVSLLADPNLELLNIREGALWIGCSHEHDHKHEHEHPHNIDPHIWLDPRNAMLITENINQKLSALDPHHAEIYKHNAQQLKQRLVKLDTHLKQLLSPVKSRAFLVFHDSLQYFESRYQLLGAGAILLNPQMPPSAKRLQSLRESLSQKAIVCVLREPEFNAAILNSLTEGFNLKQAQVDPLASKQASFSQAYFSMMEQMGETLKACLSP